ncbi:MAG: DUF1501 domain-containing protein [Planctomycetia bacterium]|nr:DUF1501 domain-containing protein [Planctomycetia bacterium]
MLTFLDPRPNRNCSGFTRRELLRVGSLALGSLTLPGLFQAKARAAAAGKPVTGKSVILLFLQGGPSHIELFDPKMTAPENVRSTTGEVQTKLAGVTFGGTFPKLAARADRLAVVRSYASGNSNHTYLDVASGGNALKATMGSLYARVAGSTSERTGIPSNVLVLPEAVQPGLKLGGNFETGALPTLTSPGELGPACAAFDPSGGGPLRKNMQLQVAPEHLAERRQLLASLDNLKREIDANGAMRGADSFQQQAFDVILRGVAEAFDLSKEDPKTVERYDTSKCFRLDEVHKWGDMRRSSNLLGKQLLLARRLCEAGCGFVTVSDCGWDMHSNGNSPKKLGGLQWLGPQLDHAVAAFLDDVHDRGLSDDILLVVTGEMGRSPRLNNDGGREHYGELTSLLLAGGGLKMGQVVGQSDRTASRPATERYTPQHLLATVMHTLFDVGAARVAPGLGNAVLQAITEGQPIPELL